MIDPYKTLGLKPECSDREIKKAYRKMAMKYHPDRNPNGEEKFKKINQANDLIGSPEKRKAFHEKKSLYSSGRNYSHENNFNAQDIFMDLFFDELKSKNLWKHIFKSQNNSWSDQFSRKNHKQDFKVVNLKVNIKFNDVIFGKDIEISRGEKTIVVSIPPGIKNKQKIKVFDKENNTYIMIMVLCPDSNKHYKRDGNNLLREITLTKDDIENGKKMKVKTPNGKIDLKIPFGIKDGEKMLIKGFGMKTNPVGDLIIIFRYQ